MWPTYIIEFETPGIDGMNIFIIFFYIIVFLELLQSVSRILDELFVKSNKIIFMVTFDHF
jgi:hypothetical protein